MYKSYNKELNKSFPVEHSKTLVFGKLLEEVGLINNLPRPVYDTITYFENKPERYETEGVFRVCGQKEQIDFVKMKYDEGENVEVENENIHVLTSIFKMYFRELPNALVTDEITELLMANVQLIQMDCIDKETVIKKFKIILDDIPDIYYHVLKETIGFLVKVSKKSEINKMTSRNLALIFGPSIFNHQDLNDMLKTDNPATLCTQYFIDNYESIFDRIVCIDTLNNQHIINEKKDEYVENITISLKNDEEVEVDQNTQKEELNKTNLNENKEEDNE